MVEYFIYWHMEAINAGLHRGNDGYMWPLLDTDYLKELRTVTLGQQLTVWIQEPVASHLTHAEIDELDQKEQGIGEDKWVTQSEELCQS